MTEQELRLRVASSVLLCALGIVRVAAAQAPVAVPAQAASQAAAPPAAAAPVCGRLDDCGGLRVLRTWGEPAAQGRAQGLLLGAEIAAVLKGEFRARFADQPQMLQLARQALPRLIEFPDDQRAQIEGIFAGVLESGVDRQLPGLGRDFDLLDLLVVNALDVFGLMGCSGFTVFGDDVEGGGVLTGRNFDWPFTGAHTIETVLLHVSESGSGAAVASVAWPGYIGCVTAINQDGIAAFLHVGSARFTPMPEPGSWPTATAARAILQQARAADPAACFALALDRLGYTSPPQGFLTRIVLPGALPGQSPVGVFEADSSTVVRSKIEGPSVVTNHFLTREDGIKESGDSLRRQQAVQRCLQQDLQSGDRRVSVEEGWAMLREVERGKGKGFGTLHSLVFRNDPWVFELRLADVDSEGRLIAAPSSSRRHTLTKEQVFADPQEGAGR